MHCCTEADRQFFNALDGRIRINEPLKKHTSFRVGGPAEIFAEPFSRDAAVRIVQYVKEKKIPLFVLGGGTNILVSDQGLKGVVLSLRQIDSKIDVAQSQGDTIILAASAGTPTQTVCGFAATHGYSGLSFAAGIPGTIGGAVNVNAGTQSGAMGDVVNALEMITPDGKVVIVDRQALAFTYRTLQWDKCCFKTDRLSPVILTVFMTVSNGDKQQISAEMKQMRAARKKSQPVAVPNAGCFFRNPDTGEPAGKLIDMAGLKGVRKGDAQISDVHGNFIVNHGQASATDIIYLQQLIVKKVQEKFGVTLVSEVKIVG